MVRKCLKMFWPIILAVISPISIVRNSYTVIYIFENELPITNIVIGTIVDVWSSDEQDRSAAHFQVEFFSPRMAHWKHKVPCSSLWYAT